MSPDGKWVYRDRVSLIRVIDGDTVDIRLDLGFTAWLEQRVRLLGIDTAELNSRYPDQRTQAQGAKLFLTSLLSEVPRFTVETVRDGSDKYGRYLAIIWLPDGTNVNELLISEGFAKRYDGGARGA